MPIPALATTTSRHPKAETAAATASLAWAGSLVSPATDTPAISAATASIGSRRRPVTTTFAPSLANRLRHPNRHR